jgi:hypothetical protein
VPTPVLYIWMSISTARGHLRRKFLVFKFTQDFTLIDLAVEIDLQTYMSLYVLCMYLCVLCSLKLSVRHKSVDNKTCTFLELMNNFPPKKIPLI